MGESRRDVQPLLLGAVVVVDLFFDGRDGAQGLDVQANGNLVLVVLVLEVDNRFLDVVAAVFSQGLNKKGFTFGMTRRASAKA